MRQPYSTHLNGLCGSTLTGSILPTHIECGLGYIGQMQVCSAKFCYISRKASAPRCPVPVLKAVAQLVDTRQI